LKTGLRGFLQNLLCKAEKGVQKGQAKTSAGQSSLGAGVLGPRVVQWYWTVALVHTRASSSRTLRGTETRKYWGTKWHGNGTDAILWLRLVCDLTVHSFSLYRRLRFSKVFIDGGSRFHQTDDPDACLCGSPLPLVSLFFLLFLCLPSVARACCIDRLWRDVRFVAEEIWRILSRRASSSSSSYPHQHIPFLLRYDSTLALVSILNYFLFWSPSLEQSILPDSCSKGLWRRRSLRVVRIFFLSASGSVELTSNGFWFR